MQGAAGRERAARQGALRGQGESTHLADPSPSPSPSPSPNHNPGPNPNPNPNPNPDPDPNQVAKLESTISLQKDHAKELRRSLTESREWVDMLDEELEVAQGAIFNLRRELQLTKQKLPPGAAAAAASDETAAAAESDAAAPAEPAAAEADAGIGDAE